MDRTFVPDKSQYDFDFEKMPGMPLYALCK